MSRFTVAPLALLVTSCLSDPTSPPAGQVVGDVTVASHWSLRLPGEEAGDPPVPFPRLQFGMLALPGGRALLVGGMNQYANDPTFFTDRCAIYDVAGNAFTPYPPLPEPRAGIFSASLRDGRVVVAGGFTAYPDNVSGGSGVSGPGMAFGSASYLSDPAAAEPRWIATGSLPFPKANYNEPTNSVVRLRDGRLLLVGGHGLDFGLGRWDPTSMIFTPGKKPSPGSWDLTRDQTRRPLPVHSGSGSSLTQVRIDSQPEGLQYTPRVSRLFSARGGFRPEDEGQPLILQGTAHPQNRSSAAEPFFVYRVLGPRELLFWNPRAVDEEVFRGTWAIGGRRPWTRAPLGTFWTSNVVMGDGKVLRPGGISGYDIQLDTHEPLVDVAEVFDPQTQRWSQSPPMPPVVGSVVATQVAPAGSTLDLDLATGRLTLHAEGAAFTPEMRARWLTLEGAATPGNDGAFRIWDIADASTITVENPEGASEPFAGRWTVTDGEDSPRATSGPRAHPIAVALSDGRVLVAGGHVEHKEVGPEGVTAFTGAARTSALIYDPAHPEAPWTLLASRMHKRRAFRGQSAPLADGRAILFSGYDPTLDFVSSPQPFDVDVCDYYGIAETDIFDPVHETFDEGPRLPSQITDFDFGGPELVPCDIPASDGSASRTLTLDDGQVLNVGGAFFWDGVGDPGNTITLYTP